MTGIRFGLAAGVALIALATPGCGDAETERRDSETRALMAKIYGGLRVALPEAVGEEPFSDPAREADVRAALALLAENAEALERHTEKEDEQERYLARSIARDARELQREHAAGRFDRAAFLTRTLTENCVACHARLPDRESRPLAKGFVDAGVLASLPDEDRVALQMATRRFDDALATLEARLLGPDHPALLIGALTDYLVLSIRVKDDYARPAATLARFAERPDLWSALERDVDFWVESLPKLRKRTRGAPKLAVARELVEEARLLEPFVGSHRALVHYVAASAVLERWIDARPGRRETPARETAEAFYLRGLIEGWIGRNYWVSSAPFLLETAIRLAPGEPLALDAYDLLERETLLAWEGVEDELPPEDEARLAELRTLIGATRR